MKTTQNNHPGNTQSIASEAFEALYLDLRNKEGRTYTDEEVNLLPYISAGHPNEKEWAIRKLSSERLINYIKKQKTFLNILEVGSGNGWLAAKLADLPQIQVTALEPSRIETEQAMRVFKKDNLKFITGFFEKHLFNEETKFDLIIFAASIQYFSQFNAVIEHAFTLLNPNGRIHIMDTNFYREEEVSTAQERCKAYYDNLGFPLMSTNYFHHLKSDVEYFKHQTMFNPRSLWNRLTRQRGFYWFILR